MLYDPKWEIQVKADPFSLESLIAWLEKMPADEVYCFKDWGGCLVAKWAKSIDPNSYTRGRDALPDIPTGFHYAINGRVVLLVDFKDIASGGFALDPAEWTFGKALTRAREALASRA